MKKIPLPVKIIFLVILAILLVAEFFIEPHANFKVDGEKFFYAIYGFISCAIIVAVSWLLGFILKRKENYYVAEDKNDF